MSNQGDQNVKNFEKSLNYFGDQIKDYIKQCGLDAILTHVTIIVRNPNNIDTYTIATTERNLTDLIPTLHAAEVEFLTKELWSKENKS